MKERKVKDPVCGMNVDRKSSLTLFFKGKSYYFCSSHCAEKFKEKRGIPDSQRAEKKGPRVLSFLKNKVIIVSMVLLALCLSAEIIGSLKPFRHSLLDYGQRIWWAIALGLVFGGMIDYCIPRQYVSSILARGGRRKNIFNAVVLGFLMSACSHGILALAIQLHKKGASTPSVVAFLMASPWANLPLTIMLIGFFGLIKALYIILVAIIVAITTGFIFEFLQERGMIERNTNSFELERDFSIAGDIRKRWREYRFNLAQAKRDVRGIVSGAVSLANMVLWWILLGMGLASLAGAYIPQDFFYQYMGPTVAGLLITLLLATVLEVCSEGTAPLAFEIFKQTGALGNSFVFLMAGVATDYTEIGLLWHNVGRRTALWLPVVSVPQIVLYGVLANLIF